MEGPAHEPEYTTGACLLTDEFEVHFVGAYHWDDESHGPVVGPHVVDQFAFGFQGGDPLPPGGDAEETGVGDAEESDGQDRVGRNAGPDPVRAERELHRSGVI